MLSISSMIGLFLFLFLFIGDYTISGIYLLPVIASLSLVFSLSIANKKIKFSKDDFVIFGFLVLFTFLDLGRLIVRDPYIESRVIVNASLILVIPFFVYLQSITWRTKWFAVFGAIFTAGAYLSEGRGFIFGPNVLYRVILFLSFCSGLRYAYYLGSLLAPVVTLSRGAFVSSFVVFLQYMQRKGSAGVIVLSVLMLLVLSVTTSALVESLQLPRYLALYDFGGSTSILDRQSVLASMTDMKVLVFGMTDDLRRAEYGFVVYPHNSIIELIWSYGIFGLFFSIYIAVCFFRISTHFGKVLYLILVLPTFFSGGYIDNMAVILFSCMLVKSNA